MPGTVSQPCWLRRIGPLAVSLVLLAIGSGCGSSTTDGAPPATTPPFKVTVAGDSISIGLGAALRQSTTPPVLVKVIGVEGTGLARPDRFDWPARLTELVHDFPPQVLVLSLSSNDAQDLADRDGRIVAAFGHATDWDREYKARLAASFDAFSGTATRVLWIGHLRTSEDRVGATNRHIQQLAREVATSRPFVTIDDFGDLLQFGDERADRCLMPDGLHLTAACLDEAAHRMRLRLEPA